MAILKSVEEFIEGHKSQMQNPIPYDIAGMYNHPSSNRRHFVTFNGKIWVDNAETTDKRNFVGDITDLHNSTQYATEGFFFSNSLNPVMMQFLKLSSNTSFPSSYFAFVKFGAGRVSQHDGYYEGIWTFEKNSELFSRVADKPEEWANQNSPNLHWANLSLIV